MIEQSWDFLRDATNPGTRDKWVLQKLHEVRRTGSAKTVLDVAAGEGPYRSAIIEQGFTYLSHDFNAYTPEVTELGLHNEKWDYLENDFTCDILDIPESRKFDVVICTEVLEHVPDPVQSFEKLTRLLQPGGKLLITVPLLSLMHQAPFWFQSGLSPFWFQHWAKRNAISILEHKVYGDYADLMAQETARYLRAVDGHGGLSHFRNLLSQKVKRSAGLIRKNISPAVRDSAGFGVLFFGELGE